MKQYDDFLKKYAHKHHITETEAAEHKLPQYVKAYYEDVENEEKNREFCNKYNRANSTASMRTNIHDCFDN